MPFGGIEPLGHLTETYVVGGIEVWQILRDIKIRGKNIKVVSVGTIVGNDGTHRVSEFVMIAARYGDEREKKGLRARWTRRTEIVCLDLLLFVDDMDRRLHRPALRWLLLF